MNIEILEGHGTLNFKVEWQSLDGRCCVEFYETHNEAAEHAKNLFSLGRTPQIWANIEDIKGE